MFFDHEEEPYSQLMCAYNTAAADSRFCAFVPQVMMFDSISKTIAFLY